MIRSAALSLAYLIFSSPWHSGLLFVGGSNDMDLWIYRPDSSTSKNGGPTMGCGHTRMYLGIKCMLKAVIKARKAPQEGPTKPPLTVGANQPPGFFYDRGLPRRISTTSSTSYAHGEVDDIVLEAIVVIKRRDG